MKRRGVALVLLLFAMLVTAALAAGVLITTSTQTRASGDAGVALRAAEAAERGAAAAALSWNPESTLTMPVGATVGPQIARYADSTLSRAFITRLSRGSFWVTSFGSAPGVRVAPIARRVGVLHALHVPEPRLTGALTVADSASVLAAGRVDGNDVAPAAWASVCSTPLQSMAGVAAPDTSRVCDGPCGGAGGRIAGAPPKIIDSTASLSMLARLGSVTWTSLVSHAKHVLPGGTATTPAPALTGSGGCDTSVATNWGDPTRSTACANRFVIVYGAGDLIMDGGMGQGVLLADGDIELRNGAQFFGVILARDDVVAAAGPNSVSGAIIAGDARRARGDHSVIAGGTVVTYSSCAVEMSFIATAPLRRVRQRSWHRLY